MNIKFKSSKKGSAIVEAAIMLPLFLLALLSLCLLIRMVGIGQDVMNVYLQETGRIAKEAYVTKFPAHSWGDLTVAAGPMVSEALLAIRLNRALEETNHPPLNQPRLVDYRYLYEDYGMEGLISANLNYEVVLPLPLGYSRVLEFQDRVLCRAFIGSVRTNPPMGFDRMEENQKSVMVYIFPRAGERYHKDSCSYIIIYPTEVVFGEKLRSSYSPCEICHPERLALGSKVYCFQKTGKAYHRGDCPLVDRYVIPMEKEAAVSKGYSPCLKCGGGG